MTENYSIVDLSYLETIADGDKDIIKELVEIFLDQMPEFTDGFSESLQNKDWIKIAAIAHKAKSSVISMGMEQLGNLDLKNLELISKQMRIFDLQKADTITDVQQDEMLSLQRNFDGYPEDRIEWVMENANIDTVIKLIKNFNSICEGAVIELNHILSTY